MNSVKNVLFLVNNLNEKGKPKSKISKELINKMHPGVSETAKLLARQTPLFESLQIKELHRSSLFTCFTRLYFKTVRNFFRKMIKKPTNLEGLFGFFVKSSQIFFEGSNRDEEGNVAAMFWLILEDFEE